MLPLHGRRGGAERGFQGPQEETAGGGTTVLSRLADFFDIVPSASSTSTDQSCGSYSKRINVDSSFSTKNGSICSLHLGEDGPAQDDPLSGPFECKDEPHVEMEGCCKKKDVAVDLGLFVVVSISQSQFLVK